MMVPVYRYRYRYQPKSPLHCHSHRTARHSRVSPSTHTESRWRWSIWIMVCDGDDSRDMNCWGRSRSMLSPRAPLGLHIPESGEPRGWEGDPEPNDA
jgi:hypothetical protein